MSIENRIFSLHKRLKEQKKNVVDAFWEISRAIDRLEEIQTEKSRREQKSKNPSD